MPRKSAEPASDVREPEPHTTLFLPEVEALRQLVPDYDTEGEFVWQRFVNRLLQRLDGLPTPDGDGTFVQSCLAAGCEAVPVVHRNTMWKRRKPQAWDKEWQVDFETRVRLGLFLAASLRCLVHGICRLSIKAKQLEWNPWTGVFLQAGDEVRWHPFLGDAVPFRALSDACGGRLEITWPKRTPHVGQVYLLMRRFLQPREMELLPVDLLVDVLACAGPGTPGGLFGQMLYATGQIEEEKVADVFLKAVRQAARGRGLRINRFPGDLFITPQFSFLTAPLGVDEVIKALEKRGQRFARPEIYQALGAAGCLLGIEPTAREHTVVAQVTSTARRNAVPLRGLAIAHDALWDAQAPPGFLDGTVEIKDCAANQSSGGG